VDFNNRGGALGTTKFRPGTNGQTPVSATIAVPIRPDTAVEPDETFHVTLLNPSAGVVLGRSTATGTIINDDGVAPNITLGVGDASIVRSLTNTTTISIPVALSSNPVGTVTLHYAITPRSAHYSAKPSGGGDFGGKLSGL
jgi:hypothetical protein